ncbi:VOC family protein [Sphingomonas abietis]|uniref:VOC family protein n=1 Tax=Sphingomonas abietis TaxID=3012344 RepID=A0ABY7NL27_9SPHN|nr:VOC family protein [Sphingomonas abietis]WBO22257.1 VOC family protein [Sphingomonas abietis]
MSIAVVSVPVADQSAAKRFYLEIMDFDLLDDEPMGPEMRWVQLQPKTGGASIALVTWFEGLRPGGQQGLMLHVSDIDAEHARLEGLGITVSPVEAQPWGRFTMFTDPDGNGWIAATLTEPGKFVTK